MLAGRLARDIGWPLYSKDAFKELLFETLGSGDADWSRRLSQAAFALQFAAAEGAVAAGTSVLLEGNFRAGEHSSRLLPVRARLVQVACTAAPGLLESLRSHRVGGYADVALYFDGSRPSASSASTSTDTRSSMLQAPWTS